MKPILLQTMPHTGTHTVQYLFNLLGGIPTYYHHYSDWKSIDDFLMAIDGIRNRFVVVHTFRIPEEVLESYKKREASAGKVTSVAAALLAAQQNVAADWQAEFREAIMLPLVGQPDLQADVARLIFKDCGADVPDSAKLFLETWPPKAVFPNPTVPWRGFDSAEELASMKQLMNDFRILPDNDWREKVNSSLKSLSH